MRGDALVHLDEGRLLRIRIPVDRDQEKERQLRLGSFGDRIHVQRGDRPIGAMNNLAENVMRIAEVLSSLSRFPLARPMFTHFFAGIFCVIVSGFST